MNQYSVMSRGYDILDRWWFSDKGLNPREVIKEYIPNEEVKILDLCCGTFSNGYSIAVSNPLSKLYGIDLSGAMLQEAKKKISEAALNNVELVQGDATATQFADASFDYVIIGLVLHECSPELRANILREAHRVLKEDGMLIVLEWEKQSNFLRKLKYAPLYLGEVINCRAFNSFYKCDKVEYFAKHRFQVVDYKHCNYSSVILMKTY